MASQVLSLVLKLAEHLGKHAPTHTVFLPKEWRMTWFTKVSGPAQGFWETKGARGHTGGSPVFLTIEIPPCAFPDPDGPRRARWSPDSLGFPLEGAVPYPLTHHFLSPGVAIDICPQAALFSRAFPEGFSPCFLCRHICQQSSSNAGPVRGRVHRERHREQRRERFPGHRGGLVYCSHLPRGARTSLPSLPWHSGLLCHPLHHFCFYQCGSAALPAETRDRR